MLKSIKFVMLFLMIAAVFAGFVPVAMAQATSSTIPVPLLAFTSALSTDGKLLAIAADANIYNNKVEARLLPIHLIDVTSGKEVTQLEGTQTDFTTGLAFSPNGKQLVSLHGNGQLNLWDVSKGSVIKLFQLPGLRFSLPTFLADGKRLALLSPSIPTHILILDIDSGAITSYFGPSFQTYDALQQSMNGLGMGDLSYTTFAISPDGKWLVTATLNDEVDVWDIATGKMSVLTPSQKNDQLNIRPIVFMPDSKTIVYYHRQENKLHIWDISAQTEQSVQFTGGGNFGLSAKGDKIAWIDKSQVFVWDFKASQPDKVADIDPKFKIVPNGSRLYFTPDAKSLVIASLFASDEQNQIYVIPIPASKS
jgi:WD40 repeat protein